MICYLYCSGFGIGLLKGSGIGIGYGSGNVVLEKHDMFIQIIKIVYYPFPVAKSEHLVTSATLILL